MYFCFDSRLPWDYSKKETDMLQDLLDSGLSSEQAEKVKTLLKTNKI